MSALDQAFTKAYAKDAPAQAAAARQATVGLRSSAPASAAFGAKAPTHLDNVYADGSLYRLEPPQAVDVPPPHYTPPASQHRTVQRRVAGRYRSAIAPPSEVAPPAVEPTLPARRMPALGLNEIARRLAHYIPPAPAADLPPEVLVVEEPVPQPSPVPLPAVNEVRPAPVASKPQPTPAPIVSSAAEVLRGQRAKSTSASQEPSFDDVATLVEVCTPWESINDAVSGSMVILTDAPVMPAAVQALVEVAIDPIVATKAAIALPPLPIVAEPVSPPIAAEPARKKYRVDPPQPAAIQPPHIAPARDVAGELPPSTPPLATLTPEETESLIGSPSPAPSAAAQVQAQRAAVAAAAPEPLVPMWEVDRFQWPGICDRLMKDEQSYFAQAGGKLVAAAKDGLKTLGITGSRRGEGRTTLALCLARCAAQAGLNVAMIDADFTRPQLAAVIGLEVAYGWQDAAQGKIPLPEAAVRSLADKITVLPLEASSVAWPLAMSDKRVAALIRTVSQTHDLVIIDLGPLSGGSELLFAADEAAPLDAAIVLRDLRYATPIETQAIGQRLHDSGVEAVGIAENFVPAEKARL